MKKVLLFKTVKNSSDKVINFYFYKYSFLGRPNKSGRDLSTDSTAERRALEISGHRSDQDILRRASGVDRVSSHFDWVEGSETWEAQAMFEFPLRKIQDLLHAPHLSRLQLVNESFQAITRVTRGWLQRFSILYYTQGEQKISKKKLLWKMVKIGRSLKLKHIWSYWFLWVVCKKVLSHNHWV